MVTRTVSLFAHADDPMAHTMDYPGDPGLFGPDSISWEVMGDASGFIAGIRALLIQARTPRSWPAWRTTRATARIRWAGSRARRPT